MVIHWKLEVVEESDAAAVSVVSAAVARALYDLVPVAAGAGMGVVDSIHEGGGGDAEGEEDVDLSAVDMVRRGRNSKPWDPSNSRCYIQISVSLSSKFVPNALCDPCNG